MSEQNKPNNNVEEIGKLSITNISDAEFDPSKDKLLEIHEHYKGILPNASEVVVKTLAFRKEIESVINKHSKENGSNTPDFILAEYLLHCLENFDRAVNAREKYYTVGESVG